MQRQAEHQFSLLLQAALHNRVQFMQSELDGTVQRARSVPTRASLLALMAQIQLNNGADTAIATFDPYLSSLLPSGISALARDALAHDPAIVGWPTGSGATQCARRVAGWRASGTRGSRNTAD